MRVNALQCWSVIACSNWCDWGYSCSCQPHQILPVMWPTGWTNVGTGAGSCGLYREWQALAEELITIVFFSCLFFVSSFLVGTRNVSVAYFSSSLLFFLSGTRLFVVLYFRSVSWLAEVLRVSRERLLFWELFLSLLTSHSQHNTSSHNIHALLHRLFHRTYLYSYTIYCSTAISLCCVVLQTRCSTVSSAAFSSSQ
jgi:hypothetical protein